VYYDVDLIADNVLTRSRINPRRCRAARIIGVGLSLTLPWARRAGHVGGEEPDRTTRPPTRSAFPLPGRSMFVTASYGFGAPSPAAPPAVTSSIGA
jgi:hypothetical protein